MSMPSGGRSLLLTPSGCGAIAVIRVTGTGALTGVNQALRLKSSGALSSADVDRLRYGRFVDGDEVLDDVIVSHTTVGATPVVDIAAHGGVRIVERILQTLDGLGLPLAEKGDSQPPIWPTENLIEREALQALARAKTERAIRFLAWQRRHLVPGLVAVIAEAQTNRDSAARKLDAMINGYRAASVVINGAIIALVGPPNSGKSTLFNRLVGRTAVVVSDTAGTTRDWVTQTIEVHGIPLTLVDTAGQGTCTDGLERTAADAGRRMAQGADLCLLLLDGSVPYSLRDIALWTSCSSSVQRVLVVSTKLDLGTAWGERPRGSEVGSGQLPVVRVSAVTEAGLDRLFREVFGLLEVADWVDNTPCLFTERQVGAAKQVRAALRNGWKAAQSIMAERLIPA